MEQRTVVGLATGWFGSLATALTVHLDWLIPALSFVISAAGTLYAIYARRQESSVRRKEEALLTLKICHECMRGSPPETCPLNGLPDRPAFCQFRK